MRETIAWSQETRPDPGARAHDERAAGFLHLFKEQFPQVQNVDLAGIYNIGSGAEGIGRALKEAGADRKIVFIGHGLTPGTRALLIDGTMNAVITQNPQGAVMNCVRTFANLRDGRAPTSGVETTRSQVIFRENFP